MTLKFTFLTSLFLCVSSISKAQTDIKYNYPFPSNTVEIIKSHRISGEPLPVNFLQANLTIEIKRERRAAEELPTKSKFYKWVSNAWAYEYDKRYEYSNDGLLLKESTVEIDGSNEIILSQIIFTYNNFGAKTSETHIGRIGNELKPIEKDSFGYTPNGDLILQEYYDYDLVDSKWVQLDGWKYSIEYEGGNLKSRTFYQFYNTYEMTAKDEYTYDGKKILTHIRTTYHGGQIDKRAKWNYYYQGNMLKSMVAQEYFNGEYSNKVRTTIDTMLDYSTDKLDKILIWNTLSLVYDTKMTGYTEESSTGVATWKYEKKYELEWTNDNYKNMFYYWDNGTQSWVNDYEITRTITGNKSVTLTRAPYQGIWYDDYRETRAWGVKGEEIEYKQEFYYEDWDEWDVINWYRLDKVYDANGKLLEIIELELDPNNYILVNNSKEEFSSWDEVNIGVKTLVTVKNFQVYPNPTSNNFVIYYNGGESYNVILRTITGAVLYSVNNQSLETRINTNDLGLQSGVYLITIENLNNSTIEIHKLLVE